MCVHIHTIVNACTYMHIQVNYACMLICMSINKYIYI